MTRILALDIATNTGWAGGDGSRPARHGVYTIQNHGDRIGGFLLNYARWLNAKIAEIEPEWIIYESPIITHTTSLMVGRKLYGLTGITEVIAGMRGFPENRVKEIEAGKWRSSFLGAHYPARRKGMAPGQHSKELKQAAITVAKLHGYQPNDDNDADALGIWTYAQGILAVNNRIKDI